MVIKSYKELEFERKTKMVYDEVKKWSLDDFKEQMKINKKSTRILRTCLVLLVLFSYVGLIFTYGFFNLYNEEKIDDKVMLNVGNYLCDQINQTNVNTYIFKSGKLVVVCNKNNVVVGESYGNLG